MSVSRLRLLAQGAAIGLVCLLFALLAWSLLYEEGGDLAAAANRGVDRRHPTLRSRGLMATANCSAPPSAGRS